MSYWTELQLPTERELVIGFYDLRGYTQYCQATESARAFEVMAGYHHLVSDIIARHGGLLIKLIGDAGMFAFPSEAADDAIHAVQAYRCEGNAWLLDQDYRGRVRTVLHAGPVAIGRIDAQGRELIDVIGSTVNIAGAMRSEGEIAITPALFRKLSAETRTLFKKHTPPISYIGVDDLRPG